jgi:hypothetical protein
VRHATGTMKGHSTDGILVRDFLWFLPDNTERVEGWLDVHFLVVGTRRRIWPGATNVVLQVHSQNTASPCQRTTWLKTQQASLCGANLQHACFGL